MNCRISSRLLLSLLLLQPLLSGTPVHASPSHHGTAAAARHGRPHGCATLNVHFTENVRDGSSASTGESRGVAPPVNTGCCSQSCSGCDCARTAVVSVTLFGDAGVVAAQLTVIGLAALPIEVRAFEFFRPPI